MSQISLIMLEDLPALLMHWQAYPEVSDIRTSSQALYSQLNRSSKPLYIMVDLRENIHMPLSETINSALQGIYTHPNFLACLIIGGHGKARIVANIVQRISRQNKILWFKDETEAYHYIESQVAGNGV